MNVERLHAIADALRLELVQTNQIGLLGSLASALANQLNSPQDPGPQQQVVQTLTTLSEALSSAPSNEYPATWRQVLEEIGASHLLGESLAEKLRETFARNQITPAIARDEVATLLERSQGLSTAVEQVTAGLTYLQVGRDELEPGEAEVSVGIPRPAVREELPSLGSELGELQKILGPFLELAEGSRPPLKVKTISSSDFVVYLAMAPGAALSVATALDKILDVYKKLLEVRRLRQEMADQGVTDSDLAAVDARANSMMAEGTKAIADEMVAAAAPNDEGRANELRIELRLSLNALANRIDHGYHIDVRAEPESEPDEGTDEAPSAESDDRAALNRIAEMSPRLTFINSAGKPILSLPEKQIPEGD